MKVKRTEEAVHLPAPPLSLFSLSLALSFLSFCALSLTLSLSCSSTNDC